mmetsp:Transcript_22543/g.29450  ORF Transcript_22543/g.29450 Transcript_22543/m.29450 type:complete len:547 (+) Transcript_22543:89-1729(+)
MRKQISIIAVLAGAQVALSFQPFQFNCPDFFQSIVPPSLYCQMCPKTPKLDGTVTDCACNFETVDAATVSYFHPLLTKLQQTSFFRHFKVHLDDQCPFWDDGGHTCFAEGCMVKTCTPDEIPAPWREKDEEEDALNGISQIEEEDSNPFGCEENFLNTIHAVLRDTDDSVKQWSDGEDDSDLWIHQDEAEGMVYVDLLKNPERFTGYVGQSTWKIWKAIYEENCFEQAGQCLEKRVFYRLISGLQSSITTHIAGNFYYPPSTLGGEGHWGPNIQMFEDKVGKFPERLDALYFTYVFLLRAVAKASSELESFDYRTGSADDDLTTSLMRALVRPDHPLVESSEEAKQCQRGFDETQLFVTKDQNNDANLKIASKANSLDGSYEKFGDWMDASQSLKETYGDYDLTGEADIALKLAATEESVLLRSDFQSRFRNISRIMDCVSCEKCRLWGKLQILGIGTALKILLSPDDWADDLASEKRGYSLQRNEVTALMNTLAQLSKSVQHVNEWRERERIVSLVYFSLVVFTAFFFVTFLITKLFRFIFKKKI